MDPGTTTFALAHFANLDLAYLNVKGCCKDWFFFAQACYPNESNLSLSKNKNQPSELTREGHALPACTLFHYLGSWYVRMCF